MKKDEKINDSKTIGKMCFRWMIPGVEQWLERMSSSGWQLREFNHAMYYFRRSEPKKCRYYIVLSELGSSEEADIAKELIAKGAVAFGQSGRRFGGAELVLCIDEESTAIHLESYYLKRNSRIIGSFLNMIGAFVCFAVCLTAYFGLYEKNWQSVFFSNLFLLLMAGVFGVFLYAFVRKCKKTGEPYSFRKQ